MGESFSTYGRIQAQFNHFDDDDRAAAEKQRAIPTTFHCFLQHNYIFEIFKEKLKWSLTNPIIERVCRMYRVFLFHNQY